MKKAKEICSITVSGQLLSVNTVELLRTLKQASIGKRSKVAIERSCKACQPPQNLPINQGWWLEFGLDKNPGVYGPMPRLRTGHRYRMEEARRMGWMAWVWHDEYEEDRKGVQPQSSNNN